MLHTASNTWPLPSHSVDIHGEICQRLHLYRVCPTSWLNRSRSQSCPLSSYQLQCSLRSFDQSCSPCFDQLCSPWFSHSCSLWRLRSINYLWRSPCTITLHKQRHRNMISFAQASTMAGVRSRRSSDNPRYTIRRLRRQPLLRGTRSSVRNARKPSQRLRLWPLHVALFSVRSAQKHGDVSSCELRR